MDLSNLQFNNQTWVLVLPLFLMAIDILTGYLTAWQSATVQSGKMRSGLVKKSGEIIEIIVIEVLGQAINLPQEVVQAISAYKLLFLKVCFLFRFFWPYCFSSKVWTRLQIHVPLPQCSHNQLLIVLLVLQYLMIMNMID